MNVTAGVVVPPGVATVMLLAPIVAVDETLKVAVISVGLTTVSDPGARITPPVRPPIVVPAAVKLVPVRVTATARVPDAGCVAMAARGGFLALYYMLSNKPSHQRCPSKAC